MRKENMRKEQRAGSTTNKKSRAKHCAISIRWDTGIRQEAILETRNYKPTMD